MTDRLLITGAGILNPYNMDPSSELPGRLYTMAASDLGGYRLEAVMSFIT